ncbi:hypothetical protein [Rubrivirga sp.]
MIRRDLVRLLAPGAGLVGAGPAVALASSRTPTSRTTRKPR